MQNFTWLNNFVRQNFRKAEFNRARKGFTLIELIVAIAIIGILAGIVVAGATGYINKAKIARANVDASNIGKALTLFYAEYGDYPYSQGDNGCSTNEPDCYAYADPTTGEPYLTVGGEDYYLSEFYKSDWDGFNAGYFCPTCFFGIYMSDTDPSGQGSGDGKIGCIEIYIYDADFTEYGKKISDKRDCPDMQDVPFDFVPINER